MLPSQTFILCKLPYCPKKGSGGEVIKLDGFLLICWLSYIQKIMQIFTSFQFVFEILWIFSAGQTDLLLYNLLKSKQHCCNRRNPLD